MKIRHIINIYSLPVTYTIAIPIFMGLSTKSFNHIALNIII